MRRSRLIKRIETGLQDPNVINDITVIDKLEILKRDFPTEFNKYHKTMSYQIMSVEIDALYNVLVLCKDSEYELTRRHESKVREILSRKK